LQEHPFWERIVINIRNLSYSYPGATQPALVDINLELERGSNVLLTGLSGSGKSTLLRAFNGLVPRFHGGRFSGQVVVGGLDTRHTSIESMAAQVGLMFQEPSRRFVSRSVVDEIAFGLEAAGLEGSAIRRRVDEVVERFALAGLLDRQVDKLSGGEQQRVALAAVLSRLPGLVLLDEPTSQLDALASRALIEWMRELIDSDELTVMVAEHRFERWSGLIDTYLYLTPEGKMGGFGKRRQALVDTPYDHPVETISKRLGLDNPEPEALRQALQQAGIVAERKLASAGPIRMEAMDLDFAYNGIPALRGASLALREGEIVALMGPNGSGKTTLLRCLMGLNRVQDGRICMEGRFIHQDEVTSIARSVAYVPQWPSALLFADTVSEELWWTLRNHNLEENPPIHPEALLKELDLHSEADRYPRDLSAGQIQRAALAAVLVTKPGVLLLDEPTLGMDPLIQRRLGRLLTDWRKAGRAVLVATHDSEFAAAYADRVVVMDQGRIEDDGPAAETLFAHPELRTVLQEYTGVAQPASPITAPGALEGDRDLS
jgi:energy-coupling factor transport system ATP-binding protein